MGDNDDAHPMEAAFTTAFSTPPAAETCGPIFHRATGRSGKPARSGEGGGLFFRRFVRADDPDASASASVNASATPPVLDMSILARLGFRGLGRAMFTSTVAVSQFVLSATGTVCCWAARSTVDVLELLVATYDVAVGTSLALRRSPDMILVEGGVGGIRVFASSSTGIQASGLSRRATHARRSDKSRGIPFS